MKIRNNNKKVIRNLARAEYRSNHSRNRLMILAVAMTVVVIFCIFSVMKGRIDAEYLMEVRHNGDTANTSLENPTREQIEQISQLSYVKDVGAIYHFANARVDGTDRFACVVADENAYEKMYLPAFTDVTGEYPDKKNEIMLSIRGLQEIGITKPTLGMKISVDIAIDQDDIRSQTFLLSGYYTEYVHPIEGPPIGFFTESYLNDLGFTMEHPTELKIRQKDHLAGELIEQKLYEDVETKDEVQRFESQNSVNYNVIVRTVGGYDVAALGILLIFLCVFFLNYNVMNISVNRQLQYYGLLKTLGATNRQIRATLYQQTLKIALTGCVIGGVISSLIVEDILPRILSVYYLNNFGVSSEMIQFHTTLFIFSLLAAIGLAFVSVLIPAYKAGRIVPVEAVKYVKKANRQSKKVPTETKKNSVTHMAWKNVMRNKHSMLLTTISLFVGLSAALASILITKGMDYTNNFALLPDFSLEAFSTPLDESYDDAYLPLTNEDIEYFYSLDGVEDVQTLYGNFIYTSAEEDVWQPYLKAYENEYVRDAGDTQKQTYMETVKSMFCSTIYVADQEMIEALEQYVTEHDIAVDMESFKNGEGAIGLDGASFSEKLAKRANALIGESFEIQDYQKNTLGEMQFAGNIDLTKEDCPSMASVMKMFGPDLLVTKEAFEKLNLQQRALHVDIYVNAEKEPEIKTSIKRMIEAKKELLPPSVQDEKLPYLNVNSDDLAAAQDEIKTMQIAMYTVSILLIVLGIFNYLNTTIVGLWGRRREIAMMEAIGITRKQLRQMLVWEGIYYSLIISGLLVTAGSGILYLVFCMLHARVGYAQFYFPALPLVGILIVMFLVCLGVPVFLYKRIATESVIDRLRMSRE